MSDIKRSSKSVGDQQKKFEGRFGRFNLSTSKAATQELDDGFGIDTKEAEHTLEDLPEMETAFPDAGDGLEALLEEDEKSEPEVTDLLDEILDDLDEEFSKELIEEPNLTTAKLDIQDPSYIEAELNTDFVNAAGEHINVEEEYKKAQERSKIARDSLEKTYKKAPESLETLEAEEALQAAHSQLGETVMSARPAPKSDLKEDMAQAIAKGDASDEMTPAKKEPTGVVFGQSGLDVSTKPATTFGKAEPEVEKTKAEPTLAAADPVSEMVNTALDENQTASIDETEIPTPQEFVNHALAGSDTVEQESADPFLADIATTSTVAPAADIASDMNHLQDAIEAAQSTVKLSPTDKLKDQMRKIMENPKVQQFVGQAKDTLKSLHKKGAERFNSLRGVDKFAKQAALGAAMDDAI